MTDFQQPEVPTPDWEVVKEAGGIHEWVLAELRRRDLTDEDVDTSSLSDAAMKRYKARRDEERRVRKLLFAAAWASYRNSHLVHLGAGIFYHDVADIDRYDIDDLEHRRETNELPPLPDVQALTKALQLTIPTLRQLAFHREVDSGSHYHRWLVPKRTGGERLISAPKPTLKTVQRWIARHITEHVPVHAAVHGFVHGRGTVTNAAPHIGASVVVKMDLKDFYPTITFPRVKGYFRKAGYGEQVATVLALLVTESPREQLPLRGRVYHVAIGPRSLPQGAPTSPSITNSIFLTVDHRIARLAAKLGFRYTRYADDLTFSWHSSDHPLPKDHPKQARAERRKVRDGEVGRLIRGIHKIAQESGFEVHPDKTRILRSGRRQKVTGLVVNRAPGKAAELESTQTPRVPRKYVRQLRAAIHNRERGRPLSPDAESLAQLRGMAAYVAMADPQRGRELLARIDRLTLSSPAASAEEENP